MAGTGRDARIVWMALAALLLLGPGEARAAGYEVGDVGAVALGRGGAFVARADDLTALWHNPAGLAGLGGTRLLGSLELVLSRLAFARAGADGDGQPYRSVSNEGGPGYVPFAAVSSDFGNRGVTLALGGFGPSAYGRARFDPEGPQRFQFVGMDLLLSFYGAAVAWRPHRDLDLGVALHVGHVIKAEMRQALNAWFGTAQGPNAGYDLLATLDFRNDFGFGMLVGALYRPPGTGLQIGLSVRPFPIRFDLDGTLTPSYPGAYLDRLAQSGRVYLTDDRASTTLELPTTVRLGIRWAGTPGGRAVDVEADAGWERWSVVDETRVRFAGALAIRQDVGQDDLHRLDDIVIARDWKDVWSVRLGSDVEAVPGLLTVRLGASWESGAVPDRTTRLDFPSFQRFGVSGGFTVRLDPVEVSVGYAHLFQPTRDVAAGTSASTVAMPVSPCRPPFTGTACAVQGQAPGPEVGAGRYESGFDVVTLSVGATFGP